MRALVITVTFALAIAGPVSAQSSDNYWARSSALSYVRADGPILVRTSLPFTAPLCDAKKVQSLRSRRTLGAVLMVAAVGVGVVGSSSVSADRIVKVYALSTIAGGVGYFLRYMGNGYDDIMVSTVNAVQIGRTTRTELVDCLGSPRQTMSGKSGDVATWVAIKPPIFGSGSARTAAISFRSDVATEIQRTEWH